MPLNILSGRRMRHYMRLQYPVAVVVTPQGFYHGQHPDLPGCSAIGSSPEAMYAILDKARRSWIREQIRLEQSVPLPNAHLDPDEVTVPDSPIRAVS